MKPTAADLIFYHAKQIPLWALSIERKHIPNARAALHRAINGRARGIKPTSRAELNNPPMPAAMEAGNACNVLQMVRRRGEPLGAYMRHAAIEYASIQPKRAATYRRWLRRLDQT